MSVQVDTTANAPDRFGKFFLLRPIRKGGVGLLALAFDPDARRVVALKRLHPSQRTGDAAARFRDEIQVSFRLAHPNLVRAVETGSVGDEVYLALEWIPGQDADALAERARRFDQRLPLPVAAAIVRQACRALEYAHLQGGFVHRDLSPSNIVIAYDGVTRVVDFGFAWWELKSSKTIPGLAPGTLGFLAPEQRAGGRVDARADLFSLGAVFYFLLTGLPTFGGGEDNDSKEALRARLAEQRVELPAPLVTFLWRALQASPSRRFESAVEMGRALEDALGAPIAGEAELGELVRGLFPVEKKLAEEELAAWLEKLGEAPAPAQAQKTAVVSRAQLGLAPAKSGARPRRQIAMVAAGAIAVAAVVSVVGWTLLKPNAPPSEVTAPVHVAPVEKAPAEKIAPAEKNPAAEKIAPTEKNPAAEKTAVVEKSPSEKSAAEKNPTAEKSPAVEKNSAAEKNSAVEKSSAVEKNSAAEKSSAVEKNPAVEKASAVEKTARVAKNPAAEKNPAEVGHEVEPVAPAVESTPAQARFREAERLARAGQVQAARAIFDELVQDAGVRPQVKLALAELDYKAGQYARATANAGDAIELGAGARAFLVRAISELRAGRPDDAARDFERVLALEPNNEDARAGLERARGQHP